MPHMERYTYRPTEELAEQLSQDVYYFIFNDQSTNDHYKAYGVTVAALDKWQTALIRNRLPQVDAKNKKRTFVSITEFEEYVRDIKNKDPKKNTRTRKSRAKAKQ